MNDNFRRMLKVAVALDQKFDVKLVSGDYIDSRTGEETEDAVNAVRKAEEELQELGLKLDNNWHDFLVIGLGEFGASRVISDTSLNAVVNKAKEKFGNRSKRDILMSKIRENLGDSNVGVQYFESLLEVAVREGTIKAQEARDLMDEIKKRHEKKEEVSRANQSAPVPRSQPSFPGARNRGRRASLSDELAKIAGDLDGLSKSAGW